MSSNNDANDTTWWTRASGMSGAMFSPVKYVLMRGKDLSTSTVFGVKDQIHGWVFRIDKPHKGCDYSHMNVRHRFTQRPDPHTWMPPGTTLLGKSVTKFTDVAVPVLFTAAVVHDTAKIGTAVYSDLKTHQTLGSESAKTTASVAATWVGGYAGGIAGSQLGYLAGGVIGSCLLVGFVPGATLGAVVGTYVVGAAGATEAKKAAESAIDHYKISENQPTWNDFYSAVLRNGDTLLSAVRGHAAALFPNQIADNAAGNPKFQSKL